jgi:dTDP-4-amino-4,6-dideoxygalactose transaminase
MIPVFKSFTSPYAFDILKETIYTCNEQEKMDSYCKLMSFWLGTDYCYPVRNIESIRIILQNDLCSDKYNNIIVSPFSNNINSLFYTKYYQCYPLFADIDESNGNMSVQSIKDIINENTCCVIVSNLGGYPSNLEEIKMIAGEIPIIIDGTYSFGSKMNKKPLGEYGSVIMPFNKESIIDINNTYVIGTNTDIPIEKNATVIESIIGTENLQHVLSIIQMNTQQYLRYKSAFSELSSVKFLTYNYDISPNYSRLPILVEKPNEFILEMAVHDIEVIPLYNKRIDDNTYNTPVAQEFAKKCVFIPIGPWITPDKQEYMINTIKKIRN